MNVEDLYNYCLSIHGAEATTPFGDNALVMKVCGKMFALIPLDGQRLSISLKCDPELAQELRGKYSSVEGAYHMNKKYWNMIYIDGAMGDEEIKKWIHHSVDEVIKKLSKLKQKEYYESMEHS